MLSLRILPVGGNIFTDLRAVLEPSFAALPSLGDQISQVSHFATQIDGYLCEQVGFIEQVTLSLGGTGSSGLWELLFQATDGVLPERGISWLRALGYASCWPAWLRGQPASQSWIGVMLIKPSCRFPQRVASVFIEACSQ
jgi:hypothetical protein